MFLIAYVGPMKLALHEGSLLLSAAMMKTYVSFCAAKAMWWR